MLDEESISSPYTGQIPLKDIGKEFQHFLSKMDGARLPSSKRFIPLNKLLCRARMGPNGPSVATSHIDAEFYKENPSLMLLLFEFNQLLGQS
jgi:hypothetical protein